MVHKFSWNSCFKNNNKKNARHFEQVLEEPVAKWQNVGGKNLLVSLLGVLSTAVLLMTPLEPLFYNHIGLQPQH